MTDSTATIAPPTLAEEVREALSIFAGFLAQHPDLPLSKYDAMSYHVHADTDEQQRAEIDRIAAILGVKAAENADRDRYAAERAFGPGVTYKATAIDREAMTRYSAHMKPYFEAEAARTATVNGPVAA